MVNVVNVQSLSHSVAFCWRIRYFMERERERERERKLNTDIRSSEVTINVCVFSFVFSTNTLHGNNFTVISRDKRMPVVCTL